MPERAIDEKTRMFPLNKPIENHEYLLQQIKHNCDGCGRHPHYVVVALAEEIVMELVQSRAEMRQIRKTLNESHSREQARQEKEKQFLLKHDDCRVCGRLIPVEGRHGVSIAHCSDQCAQRADIVGERVARENEADGRLRALTHQTAPPEGDWHLQEKYYNG